MADEDARDRLARVLTYGSISLNGAFVQRARPIRIWRKVSLRLSVPEMIWIILSTLAWAGVLTVAWLVLSRLPVIGDLVSFFIILPAPLLGWPTGRRIARASPYRRFSGEGLTEYLWVQGDRAGSLLGRLLGGRPVAVSEERTRAGGRPLTVEAIEWVGTARAQRMPRNVHSRGTTAVDVILRPSAVPTDWVRMRHRDTRPSTIQRT